MNKAQDAVFRVVPDQECITNSKMGSNVRSIREFAPVLNKKVAGHPEKLTGQKNDHNVTYKAICKVFNPGPSPDVPDIRPYIGHPAQGGRSSRHFCFASQPQSGYKECSCRPVALTVRASDSKSGGWGFESLLACQENQGVTGCACSPFLAYVPITNLDCSFAPYVNEKKKPGECAGQVE